MRRLVLLVFVALSAGAAACDPCAAAYTVHEQRCLNGDETSCAWIHENVDPLGVCK